jgi:hypothetical protein
MPLKLTNASQIAALNKWADSVDLRLSNQLTKLHKHDKKLVDVSAAQVILQTDGANNYLQTLLNLKAGSGVTLTSDAVGGVTITALTTGVEFSTSGQGWFAGPGMTDLSSIFVNGFNAPITGYAANVVAVSQFVLNAAWTLSKVSYKLQTSSAAQNFNFGIYDADKNRLIDSGAFDGSITTLQTKSFTAIELPPGVYYFAASATNTTMRGASMQASATTVGDLLSIINASTALVATAANATSGNVLPATLGTLTAATSASWQSIPYAIWKV